MIHLMASIPVISPIFQGILDAIGFVLSKIFDVIPNYGLSIIVLTILVRVVLLPLGIKQIQSMHNMQSLQPKIKALQTKYKGNKQKQQEEIMKLYRESGVNPLSGCWPVLLQFPILIAMYAVLRPPILNADFNKPGQTVTAADYTNNHLPADSTLFVNVTTHQNTDFLTMNLQCAAIQSGTGEVDLKDSAGKPLVAGLQDPQGNPIAPKLDCGTGIPVKVPYFLFLLFMVGTTFYQQRQMQKVSPQGSTNPQQQALFKIMPLMFGVFGISFPAGLVVYWTTSNLWQIGQQYTMLRLGHIGPAAQAAPPKPKSSRPGLLSGMMQKAADARNQREDGQTKGGSSGSTGSKGTSKGGSKPAPKKPADGSSKPPGGSNPPKKPNDGGSSAGSRKKRPKR
jgi:YidC/Oxa1 family membrane protein insertase